MSNNKRQNYKLICQKCGKEYELNLTKKRYNSGKYSKYCCISCANSRIRTDEVKQKISNGLNKFHNENKSERKEMIERIKQYHDNILTFEEIKTKYPNVIKTCLICDKEFVPKMQTNGNRISKSVVCSDKCHKQLKINNGYVAHEIALKNGTFKPWQSRKIISYPEQFWMNVLQNNDIKFVHNYYFENKYFLDFYIKINDIEIDLEIDGKQHAHEDRKIHDKNRDNFIKKHNLIVYRIKWNEINSINGSILMKKKIDNFIKFYNTHQHCQ